MGTGIQSCCRIVSKMSSFQPRIIRLVKKKATVTHIRGEKRQAARSAFEEAQMVDSATRDLKEATKMMLREKNETMLKEIKLS